ncbi:Vacuolar protein sorting-associated protein 5 [Nowakowskiella sp. JEL0078]|nr:Vacuolar protein sorting-associated protein 5 [Nowakowskiella sp. JEL0078]
MEWMDVTSAWGEAESSPKALDYGKPATNTHSVAFAASEDSPAASLPHSAFQDPPKHAADPFDTADRPFYSNYSPVYSSLALPPAQNLESAPVFNGDSFLAGSPDSAFDSYAISASSQFKSSYSLPQTTQISSNAMWGVAFDPNIDSGIDPLSLLLPSSKDASKTTATVRKQRVFRESRTDTRARTESLTFDPLSDKPVEAFPNYSELPEVETFTNPLSESQDDAFEKTYFDGIKGSAVHSSPPPQSLTPTSETPKINFEEKFDNLQIESNAAENVALDNRIESPLEDRDGTPLTGYESDNASIVPIPPSDLWGSTESKSESLDLLSPALYDPLGVVNPPTSHHWQKEHRQVSLDETVIQESEELQENEKVEFFKFDITVLVPMKIVEGLSQYMAYRVFTLSTHPNYRKTTSVVTRRYRDFHALWTRLIQTHPSAVIPPIPEKQAVGRFEDDFVESRRYALERFLRKVTRHEELQNDIDVRLFLEEESFLERMKKKEDLNNSNSNSSKGGGPLLIFDTFIQDPIDLIDNQKSQLEALESQLRAILRCIDIMTTRRREIGNIHAEFAETTRTITAQRSSKKIAHLLTRFADSHRSIVDLYEKRGRLDLVKLSSIVDEYIKTIAAIRQTHQTRARSLNAWNAAESLLTKKQSMLESTPKIRTDKISVLMKEINEAEQAVSDTRKECDKVEKQVRGEVAAVLKEMNKEVEDTIIFVAKEMRDTQKQVAEIWREFSKETVKA